MKKRVLSLMLSVWMAASLLSACGNKGTSAESQSETDSTVAAETQSAATSEMESGSSDTSKKVKIVYSQFSAGDSNGNTLQQMVDNFMDENPGIEVEIQSTGYGDYFTALATKIAGSGAPDCFELNLENFLSYAIRDNIEPLDTYFDKFGVDKSLYAANLIKAASYNGKVYGIPQTFSTVVMIYNKDLFDKAKVAYPTADWTWKEETEAAQKIRALGDDIWGLSQPVTYNELYKVVKQNNGSLVSDDGKTFTMNSKENIEALDMMLQRACGKNRVMPNTEDLAGRSDWDLFKAGKLGMIMTGIWAFSDFKENIKDFKWDIAVEPGNKTKATHLFSNLAVVNKNSSEEKKEAAFKLINYMATNAKDVDLRIKAQWELPVISDQTAMKPYLELTPPDNKKAVFESMDYAVSPPALIQYGAVVDTMKPYLDNAVLNGSSAEETLNQIQDALVNAKLMNP